jgi:hypothetical protein
VRELSLSIADAQDASRAGAVREAVLCEIAARVDANNDGSVSYAEYTAYHARAVGALRGDT